VDPDTTGTTPVPLTLISGLLPEATADLAEQVRAARPGTAVVHHDLRAIDRGIVRRRLRFGGRDETTVLELAHGCVSCTLREDLLPLLRRLATTDGVRHITLHLDEAMEPEPVCWAISHVLVGGAPVSELVTIEGVHTVLDRGSWLADATGDDTLADRGLQASADDERTVAQVALSQAEFADVLVLTGTTDPWTDAKTAAVLDRVAPSAPRTSRLSAVPAGARRGEVTDLHGPLLRGEPPLHADCGVAAMVFTAQRPFHPQRLHEALDVLLDGVVRTRGRLWVASQPDVALWLESAGGGLGVGHAGPWLDSPSGPKWTDVSPERRTLASLRWHPVHGDRAQEIFVVTGEAAPAELDEAFSGALLTDAELAAGPRTWRTYDDPFGSWHEEPCGDTDRTRDVTVTSAMEDQ